MKSSHAGQITSVLVQTYFTDNGFKDLYAKEGIFGYVWQFGVTVAFVGTSFPLMTDVLCRDVSFTCAWQDLRQYPQGLLVVITSGFNHWCAAMWLWITCFESLLCTQRVVV